MTNQSIINLDLDLIQHDAHMEDLKAFAFQEAILDLELEFQREFTSDLSADLCEAAAEPFESKEAVEDFQMLLAQLATAEEKSGTRFEWL